MSLGENTILLNDGHKMPLLGLGVYKADAGTEIGSHSRRRLLWLSSD